MKDRDEQIKIDRERKRVSHLPMDREGERIRENGERSEDRSYRGEKERENPV